ncbi:hypothetical protein BC828DRAFT_385193 [Blastocladiella britannica]|nr:hypothetical protein BC828DRAFT_385193 [Blastocladiella britannica]
MATTTAIQTFRTVLDRATHGSRLSAPFDTAAASIHASMIQAGYTLISTTVEDNGEQAVSASASSEIATLGSASPNSVWPNPASRGAASFVYQKPHGTGSGGRQEDRVLVKAMAMGTTVVVHAMRLNNPDEIVASFTFPVAQFFLPASLYPVKVPGDRETSSLLKPGDEIVGAWLNLVQDELISKLRPGVPKEALRPMSISLLESTRSQTEVARPLRQDPEPARPAPFADRPAHLPGMPFGAQPHPSPFSIGHRDLDPLGGMPPMMPPPFGGRGDAGGYGPLGGFPYGGGDGGGSIMGPGHPLFGGDGGGGSFGGPATGPWGGDQYLPPGAVPPGARFDPIGPFVPPGGGPGGTWPHGGPGGPGGVPAAGRGRGRGRGMPGYQSGEPDPDALQPPGSNMYM